MVKDGYEMIMKSDELGKAAFGGELEESKEPLFKKSKGSVSDTSSVKSIKAIMAKKLVGQAALKKGEKFIGDNSSGYDT